MPFSLPLPLDAQQARALAAELLAYAERLEKEAAEAEDVITRYEISTRLHNVLKGEAEYGAYPWPPTLKQLASLTEKEFRRTPNCGLKTVRELGEILAHRGLTFKPDPPCPEPA